MTKVTLTPEEKEALRRLNDPESDEPVSLEAMESLATKGILYEYGKLPKRGFNLTDFGESVCERLFGSRDDEFNFRDEE